MYRKYVTLLFGLGLMSVMALGCKRSDQGVRVEGSDTMVNLAQAWAEKYHAEHPEVTVQVLGGGSGVGIASLIDGNCDLANASREMEAQGNRARQGQARRGRQGTHRGLRRPGRLCPQGQPARFDLDRGVGRDLRRGRQDHTWSQLGVDRKALGTDEITRVSRQNSSGTYAYFREAVLGKSRDLQTGLDRSRAARRTSWP